MASRRERAAVAEREPCDRRDEILDAATDLFASAGYSDAVTQDLADALGVGKGTIYRHFPSKRALFLAAVDRVMRRLRARIDEATCSVADPIELPREAILAFLRCFSEHPKYVELLILERALFRDRTTPTYLEQREGSEARWQEIYRDLIRQGRVRGMPVGRITGVITDLIYGTIFTNYFSGRPRSPEDQARDILDVMFLGILGEEERARWRAVEPGPDPCDVNPL